MSFVEAYHKLDETEYYLDILCAGDSHEREIGRASCRERV